MSGIGLTFYFRAEKARMERVRIAEMSKGVGKPKVGGPLNLVDQEGKDRKDEEWRGRFMLVSYARPTFRQSLRGAVSIRDFQC